MASTGASTRSNEAVIKLAQDWVTWDPVQSTREEIAELLSSENFQELEKRMLPRISFGTAGLRAKMQAGFANMNSLTVLQASQGLCRYLEEQHASDLASLRSQGVVIGFDGRHHSHEYARITAAVFLSQGVHVHLYSDLVPTPFVPFGVLHLKAAAGVMVTASHNPKQDNGYKVYWGNACQIVEPHDRGISNHILANLQPWSADYREESLDSLFARERDSGLLRDPLEAVSAAYYERVATELCFERDQNKANPGGVKFVFTPMHGVGGRWMVKAFETFDLPAFTPVKLQMEPDPEFPTVAFPNPEEGKGALQLAMDAADSVSAAVILANDPDADRLAVAERQADGTTWKIFTGNEIGALLASYMWSQYRRRHPDAPADQCFMVNSTVSSKFIQAMANKEGFHYAETLTGFKWLGTQALALTGEGKHFLFAFEEAIGFLVGTMGWDKDGVRSGAVMAEMVIGLYAQGRTLTQHLEGLYQTYGYFITKNSYFFNYNPDVMFKMFDRMRSLTPEGYPPACGRFPIRAVRDLMTGIDTSQPDGKAILPVSRSSPMTTFYFENGAVVTIRGSGTEPKLKYYCELHGSDKDQVIAELDELVQAIVDEFLCPEQNGFKPPAH